jgi:hypothetical protein
MTDQRMNPDLIHDVLDVLDRHGYARADDEHTSRAILLISDLAHIYEGAQDHPFSPHINQASPDQTEPAPPESAAQDGVTVPAEEVKTLLAALDIAADDNATVPQPAPTAPASPVPPASRVCSTPEPTTVWPLT